MTGKDYKNEEISRLRKAAGLTQEQLANTVNTHIVHISRVENGHSCSIDLLKNIAQALSADWLDLLRPEPVLNQKKIFQNITFAVDSV